MAKKYGNGGYLYEGDELMKMQSDQEWVCRNWIPRTGRTLLIAQSKVGKTKLAVFIADKVARGEDVFNFDTEKGVVLYAALERWNDFREKLRDATGGKVPSNLKTLEYTEPLVLDSDDDKGFNILKQVIFDVKPVLVILDSKFRTTAKGDNDEPATIIWTNRINKLIKDCDCAFLILHHVPKTKYKQLVDRAAGTSYLSRWADVIIGMKRADEKDKRNPDRILEFVSNSGYEPDDITVEITDVGIVETIIDPLQLLQTAKVLDAVDLLKNALQKDCKLKPSKTIRELSKLHKISERTFWEAWKYVKP